ncbi:sodium ABC transporter ATP-binding protein [Alkalihalophilus pseudofirmus]|uniref:ABC transporter ATP-binding protein n=1 Tax=Alkalihalophilus pseudofirmus TaxID=79885 RepID=UPI000952D52B|nr:sodium ABC transporter ATP-binding protein [Alkalihalophilus pseudofirmus]
MTLKINNITKRFGQSVAVDQLSLEIPSGEMFGMLGANGAGKTTTFRMMLGLLEPTEGEMTWKGEKIDYSRTNVIGYLPEERGLYPKLKVRDQLIYLGRLKGMHKKDIITEMRMWLERFKVTDYETKRIEELSKGNQQKIQFITSVIHRPELLILDEPFSGLDPVNAELLKEAVIDLKMKGTTIVFSSHRMDHVEELCQHLCILRHGTPVVKGELREIKRSFRNKFIVIEGERSFETLKNLPGVKKFQQKQGGVRLQVEDEEVAKVIFAEVAKSGYVRRFEVEEPSLQDIFIEKVGTAYA